MTDVHITVRSRINIKILNPDKSGNKRKDGKITGEFQKCTYIGGFLMLAESLFTHFYRKFTD